MRRTVVTRSLARSNEGIDLTPLAICARDEVRLREVDPTDS